MFVGVSSTGVEPGRQGEDAVVADVDVGIHADEVRRVAGASGSLPDLTEQLSVVVLACAYIEATKKPFGTPRRCGRGMGTNISAHRDER